MAEKDSSRYAVFPQHPMARVRQRVLEDAHRAMFKAVDEKDVEPGMAEPIADMVVMALLPWLSPEAFLSEEK
jgi:hypothetical protein